jgi:hypothetical protein
MPPRSSRGSARSEAGTWVFLGVGVRGVLEGLGVRRMGERSRPLAGGGGRTS